MTGENDITSGETNDDAENSAAPDKLADMAVTTQTDELVAQSTTAAANADPSGTDHMAEMAAAMETEAEASKQAPPANAEAIARAVSGKDVNIDTLLKVPVSLSIEVGRTQIVLNDLLDTQEGSVLELERLLEEPLDILVNGALIAHGVVVLANDRFGLQITDIISLEERARSL